MLCCSVSFVPQVLRHALRHVSMKFFAPLLLTLSHSAFAGIPSGLSKWGFSTCQTQEVQERMKCNSYSAELVVFQNDGKVCGWISQSSVFRSPSAWFVGKEYREGALVRFVDTFQSDDRDYGRALLTFVKGVVAWKILEAPAAGMVVDENNLRLVQQLGASLMPPPASCEELEKLSPVASRLSRADHWSLHRIAFGAR